MTPEQELVATTYLQSNNISTTANTLNIPPEKVVSVLKDTKVKSFLDDAYLINGYASKHKIQGLLDRIISQKLQDAEESEMFISKKDIVELLELSHKMRIAEEKLIIEKLKLEQQKLITERRIEQTELLTNKKLEAADKRFHLKLEHDSKVKEQETNQYTALLERLLVSVPAAKKVEYIDAEYKELEDANKE